MGERPQEQQRQSDHATNEKCRTPVEIFTHQRCYDCACYAKPGDKCSADSPLMFGKDLTDKSNSRTYFPRETDTGNKTERSVLWNGFYKSIQDVSDRVEQDKLASESLIVRNGQDRIVEVFLTMEGTRKAAEATSAWEKLRIAYSLLLGEGEARSLAEQAALADGILRTK